MTRRLCGTVAILMYLSPALAFALPAIRPITPPGQVIMSFVDGTSINVYMEENRSYACTLLEYYPDETSEIAFSPTAQSTSGQLEGTLIGDVTPVNTAGTPGNIKASRISFIPTASANYTLSVTSAIDMTSMSVSGGSVVCAETSLYGGFNTNVNEYNFLELANTTNAAIHIKIRALASDGTVLIDNQAATIGANVRRDFDLHSLVGSSKYGTVVIMHDGPLGALKGSVSQYKIQPDASFVPIISTPLSIRDESPVIGNREII